MPSPVCYEELLDDLATFARANPQIVGLVAFGSTADSERRDEWSDHDFALITEPGAADTFRNDLSWLPHADDIALSVIEDQGGVKIIYTNGHRLEFGIADAEGFSTWAGSPARVIVGDESVHVATANVVARRPGGAVNAEREIRLMLTQIHSGVSRVRRGEKLSGSQLVRGEAIDHFLRVATVRWAADATGLDALDPRRRFEQVFGNVGARLEAAIRLPVENAAREACDLAEECLAPGWPGFPHAGLATIRQHFGWR